MRLIKAAQILLLSTGLLFSSLAYSALPAAIAALPLWAQGALVAAGVTAVSEIGARVMQQGEATLAWRQTSNLNPDQVRQVQKAIDYLKEKGFKDEAKQTQTMLNNSQSWFWRKAGSTIVYDQARANTEDLAQTYGGGISSIFNNGHIELRSVLTTNHDNMFTVDDERTRSRLIAKTLVHELEHLNKQTDALLHWHILDFWTNKEDVPNKKEYESLAQLGYSADEIQKLRERNELNAYGKDKYDKIFEQQIQKAAANPAPTAANEPDQAPTTTDASPSPSSSPTTVEEPSSSSSPTASPGDIPGPTPPSLGIRPQRAPLPPFAPPALPDYLQPGLPRPTPEQLAAAQGLSEQAGGGIPQKKSKGGQKGAKQGGYQDPATDVTEGPPRDKPPAYVDTCPQVDQTGKVLAWVPCPPGVFPGTPLPADQTAKRPGDRPGAITKDKRAPTPPVVPGTPPVIPGTPPVVIGQAPPQAPPVTPPTTPPAPPAVPGAKTPPASTAKCSLPLCYQAGQTNCEKGPLPQDPGWIPACYKNMLKRCVEGLAEEKAGRIGGYCVRPGADPSCEVRAQRVCGGK